MSQNLTKPKFQQSTNPFEGRVGLVYARVSSKRQEIEGSGLKSQAGRCVDELKHIGVPLEHSFFDSFTGGGDFMKRPAMKELLAYIDAHPHKKFVVVFDDLKRFARDVEFHLKLRATFKARNVILKCLNYSFDESPEGRFAELIMAGQAELERHQNSRQVVQKMKARLEAGYWGFPKVKGYDYVKFPEHGKLCVPNKEGLEILKPALEMFANGTFARKIDMCQYLVEKGWWKKQHYSAYINKVTEILKNPFYMGYVEYAKWDVARRKGHHQAIISEETFNLIQRRIGKNGVARNVRSDVSNDFPLRGLLVCDGCGYAVTAAWTTAKGKLFPYYFCQNMLCEFGKKSIQKKVVEDDFDELLEKTKLKPEIGKIVQAVFDKVWTEEVKNVQEGDLLLEQKKKELEAKIERLSEMVCNSKNEKLQSLYEKQLEEKVDELESLSNGVPMKEIDFSIPYRNALDKAVTLVKEPYSVWKTLPVSEQHQLFFFIFEEKLKYSKKEGYRNDNLPCAVRLFEEFATSTSLDVEVAVSKPHA